MKKSAKAYSVQIDPPQLISLQGIKKRDGISIVEQVRRAIEMWLKEKK